jgi:hypothetical protein
MTPEEEAEAYARVVYHLPWVNACERELPRGGVQRLEDAVLRRILLQRPLRLYVLLSRFCPNKLLPMLETVWPSVANSMMADATLNAIDARDAPKMFGRETYERKKHESRVRLASLVHDMVVNLWRTGGKYIQDNDEDLTGVVRELDDTIADTEAGIAAIMMQAHRTPRMGDDQIVRVARDVVVKRSLASPGVMKKFTPTQIAQWAANTVTPALVPEARRRAASNAVGQILAEAERKWRAEGMSKEQIADARAEMADTLLTV